MAEDPTRVLKSTLRDPSRDIELDDLVMGVATKIRTELTSDPRFSVEANGVEPVGEGIIDQIVERLTAYQHVLEPFAKILVVAGAWGEEKHSDLWRRAAKLIVNARHDSGNARLIALQQYVSLYLSYVSAIASVDKSNFYSLEALLDSPVRTYQSPVPMVRLMHPYYMYAHVEEWVPTAVIWRDEGRTITPELIDGFRTGQQGKQYTPVPSYLFKVLRPLFVDLIPDETDYDERFDQAEALLALKACVTKVEASESGGDAPGKWAGRYTWKPKYFHYGPDKALADEYKKQGERWAPIQHGLLGHRFTQAAGTLHLGDYDTQAINEALPAFLQGPQGIFQGPTSARQSCLAERGAPTICFPFSRPG